MSIVLVGSTSGSITLQEPAVAGVNTINLPAATGTAVLTGVTGNIDINAAGANNLTLSTNSTERLRIDSSGNVGIGTSSPTNKLSVIGADSSVIARVAGASYAVTFNSDAGSGARIEATDPTGVSSYQPLITNGSLQVFRTGNTERMRIDSSGNLLFGQTSGTNPTNGAAFVRTDSRGTYWANATTVTAAWDHYTFTNGNGQVGSIRTSASATSYLTSSDYRLKENIAPLKGALATVAQLKPVTYIWKLDGSAGQGFIAHELQAVVPDCVSGDKDAVNEDGSIKPQGVDTSFLVATLTAAIQELKGIVDTQATKIAELEAKLEGTA